METSKRISPSLSTQCRCLARPPETATRDRQTALKEANKTALKEANKTAELITPDLKQLYKTDKESAKKQLKVLLQEQLGLTSTIDKQPP